MPVDASNQGRMTSPAQAGTARSGLGAILSDADAAERVFCQDAARFFPDAGADGFALIFDLCWPGDIGDSDVHLLPYAGLVGSPVRRLSHSGASTHRMAELRALESRHLANQIRLAGALVHALYLGLATDAPSAADRSLDDRASLIRLMCRADMLAQGSGSGILSPAPTFHGLELLFDDFVAWAARAHCVSAEDLPALIARRRRCGRLSVMLGSRAR